MKLIVVAVLALVGVALAAPQGGPQGAAARVVQILRSDFEQQPEGGYVYSFETDDGTKKEETGENKVVNDEENKPHEVIVVRGAYNWVDLEGKTHSVTYYADETGFHAESEDIPKAQ